MLPNIFNLALAFLSAALVSEMLSNIFLIQQGRGFKFRFHPGNLNPFISREKTLIIWGIQLIVAGLLSIPLQDYFEAFIRVNEYYYVPIFCLALLGFVAIGVNSLNITMSKNMWIFTIVCIVVLIGSLYLLTGGDYHKLQPINLNLSINISS